MPAFLSLAAWRQRARVLKREVYTLLLAYRDPRTPWFAKAAAILVVGYAFSPIDLIPDFIPVLGYLDDLILLPIGIYFTLKLIPPAILADCRAQAATAMAQGKQPNWLAAAVIIVVWVALAILALWLLKLALVKGVPDGAV